MSAASGLVRAGDFLYVVADDEHHLGVFPATGEAPGRLIAILPGQLPAPSNERKALKPDFEALVRLPPFPGYPGGALLALPSGSRPNRRTGALLRLEADGVVIGSPRSIDFSGVFEVLQRQFAALNIEGAVVMADRLRLLQRGSKHHGQNAWIDLSLPAVLQALATADTVNDALLVGTQTFDLGSIDGIPLGFTDGAALPDAALIFTAVAEDAENSYEDGPCAGAAVGIADHDGRLRLLERLDANYKVEGIDARVAGEAIELLLVTDSDDERIPACLLSAALSPHTC